MEIGEQQIGMPDPVLTMKGKEQFGVVLSIPLVFGGDVFGTFCVRPGNHALFSAQYRHNSHAAP